MDELLKLEAEVNARLAALEAGDGGGEPPDEHIMKWINGNKELVYRLVVAEPDP
jgi:hypothetical protein